MRLNFIFLFLAMLILITSSGCVTTSENLDTAQFQKQIDELKNELKKQQDENELLRQQLAQAKQDTAEIRMPNAIEIQTALKNAGFYQGQIDGQIGSATKEAIWKFQESNGLTGDGVVGSRTWEILVKYLKTESQ